MAFLIVQKDDKTWLSKLGMDMEKLQENMYDMIKTYDEKKGDTRFASQDTKAQDATKQVRFVFCLRLTSIFNDTIMFTFMQCRPPSSQQNQDSNNPNNEQNVQQSQQMTMNG